MEGQDLYLKLLAGLPIEVQNVGSLHPLKIKDIAKIGISKYHEYLSLLVFEIDDLDLDDKQMEEIKKFTPYEVLVSNCYYSEHFRARVIDALGFFFRENIDFSIEHKVFMVGGKPDKLIYKKNYDKIKELIMKQNCLQKKEGYNPGNSKAKAFIEKLKKYRKEASQVNKENRLTLYTIVSSIAWKSHIGVDKVFGLTVYQLYDAYQRLGIIDHYDKVMGGVYAGTVDGKKIKLREIDWSKMVKI